MLETALRAMLVGIAVAIFVDVVYHAGGPVIGALFGLIFFIGRMAPRMTTTAWSTGAAGEVRTAAILDPLADIGYVVMHDLRISMTNANIDHLVIGPTGVFVVETKNVRGKVRLDGRDVRMGGRRVGVVDEVVREVAAVRGALGPLLETFDVSVDAIVCAHRAELPWFHRRVAGIHFVYPNHLRREIAKRPVLLSDVQVAELRAAAERLLPTRRK